MSRVGKRPVPIPSGVTVQVSDHDVKELARAVSWLLDNTLLEDPDRLDSLKQRHSELSQTNSAQYKELEQLRGECSVLRERVQELEEQRRELREALAAYEHVEGTHARGLEGASVVE